MVSLLKSIIFGWKKYSCHLCGSTGFKSTSGITNEDENYNKIDGILGDCPRCNGTGYYWKRS